MISGFAVAFVFLCFAYSLLNFVINMRRRHNTAFGAVLPAALFFTFVSDYFMVLMAENLAGLKFFCLVQSLYALKLSVDLKGKQAVYAIVPLSMILLFSSTRGKILETGGVYALLFAVNLMLSYRANKSACFADMGKKLFFIGLLLFAMCDIHVFLMNYVGSAVVRHYAAAALWVFYLPSQAVLAVSGKWFCKEKI